MPGRRSTKPEPIIEYWKSEGPSQSLTLLLTRGKVLLRCRPWTLQACGFGLSSGRSNVAP